MRGRGRWPWWRTAAGIAGVASVGVATVGPLAEAAHHHFAAHATAHVLLGMLGPLLLVRAALVTWTLRVLPAPYGRRLSALLRWWPVQVLTEPVVATVLAVGGLWLLYGTGLYGAAHDRPLLHLVVHLHVFGAGCLLAAALVGVDPMPHRRSAVHRAVVLVAAVAGHDILAKYLYGHPPTGVDPAAAETGAMIMYYGGDAVEVAMMVLLCAGWFAGRRSNPGPRVPERSSRAQLSSKLARSTRRW